MTPISQVTGLSFHIFESPSRGGLFLEDISDYVISYSHELGADNGCVSAQVGLGISFDKAQDWFLRGLARVLKVVNSSGGIVWQGFVNIVTVGTGGLSGETRGPLLDIGNRVSAVYSPLDVSVWPPVAGSTTITTIAEDEFSQRNYAIIEKVLSAGTCQQADAEKARDTYLLEHSIPFSSGDVNPDSNSDISITLELLGNVYWLDVYIYNDPTPGYLTITDKIKLVLAGDPNGYISTNYGGIKENGYLTTYVENQNRFGRQIIDEIVRLGDIFDIRWLFGVDENAMAYYRQVSDGIDDINYEYALSDRRQAITYGKGDAHPWDIKAGRWIFVSDWLTGYSQAYVNSDPRRKFIETVRYTAPYGVTLTGGPSGTLSQILAKIGGSA